MRSYLPEAAIGLGVLFAGLAVLIAFVPVPIATIDSSVHMLVVSFQTPVWSNVFLVVTAFGGVEAVVAIFLVLLYLYRHRPDLIARLLLALVGATISGEYVKNLLHRARPMTLAWLPPINSYSFPSGHATDSMVLYGFLAVLLYVHAHSRPQKFFAIVIPAMIILLVGFSRLALNYHFFTDVLGGYLLGAFWLAASFVLPLYRTLYHYDEVTHTEPITHPLV